MESSGVLSVLTALAKHGRLETFRLLVRAGDDGLLKSDLLARTKATAGAVTLNLKMLQAAGLVQIVPESRVLGTNASHTGGDFRCRALASPVLDMLHTLVEEIEAAPPPHPAMRRTPDLNAPRPIASAA